MTSPTFYVSPLFFLLAGESLGQYMNFLAQTCPIMISGVPLYTSSEFVLITVSFLIWELAIIPFSKSVRSRNYLNYRYKATLNWFKTKKPLMSLEWSNQISHLNPFEDLWHQQSKSKQIKLHNTDVYTLVETYYKLHGCNCCQRGFYQVWNRGWKYYQLTFLLFNFTFWKKKRMHTFLMSVYYENQMLVFQLKSNLISGCNTYTFCTFPRGEM